MLLALPPQTAPDTGSFPQEHQAVKSWLDALSPDTEPNDAAELLRGLRHSNRLTTSAENRRLVLSEFQSSLQSLTHSLIQTISPQPLPMAAKFRHSSALLDELLREETNAWKILLSQNSPPRLADARSAMSALLKQATAAVQQYRRVPSYCIRDANQIYAVAELNDLLISTDHEASYSENSTVEFLNDYAGVLVLSHLDLRQIRARQLDLTLAFLTEQLEYIRLSQDPPTHAWKDNDCVLDLSKGNAPIEAACYLGDVDTNTMRWVSFEPLVQALDARLAKTRTTLSTTLGADTLERQTLTRLRQDLHGKRGRRLARRIGYDTVNLSFGHQQISNQLLQNIDAEPGHNINRSLRNEWTQINYSAQGAAFRSIDPAIGTAQVGELVAVQKLDDQETLGMVRWVQANDDGHVLVGVEYLSKQVIPVELSRSNADEGVTDEGLIIACRINGKVTQTVLLPEYRFQTSDRLTARQKERSKAIKLGQCLQSNGLFSQFVLNEA